MVALMSDDRTWKGAIRKHGDADFNDFYSYLTPMVLALRTPFFKTELCTSYTCYTGSAQQRLLKGFSFSQLFFLWWAFELKGELSYLPIITWLSVTYIF